MTDARYDNLILWLTLGERAPAAHAADRGEDLPGSVGQTRRRRNIRRAHVALRIPVITETKPSQLSAAHSSTKTNASLSAVH